ncbi:MAG: extracellular solute-binding protein [Pirellulaceae bacterium]|nr:extracellular solute-binding protein [Pirellulaceae bacterium]
MAQSATIRMFVLLFGMLTLAACRPSSENEVVVYTALDREFSEPIFEQFTQATGIQVRPKYDSEANKTVGLVNLIINEQRRPRCDLFWNNEIINTLRLDQKGLLQSYQSPQATRYPEAFRSPDGRWYGFAARARVLLVNRELLLQNEWPTSIEALADPKWQGKVGIAKPLFGTTAAHAACLYAAQGETKTRDFFRKLSNNARIYAGNRQVAQAVAAGQILFGLTDTDDAMIEIEAGMPVEIIYPDQAADQLGTLFIPNTLAIIKGCRHPEAAQQLINFLLSAETESRLARGKSAQIPLNPNLSKTARVATPREKRAMEADFPAAAQAWDRSASDLRELFSQ